MGSELLLWLFSCLLKCANAASVCVYFWDERSHLHSSAAVEQLFWSCWCFGAAVWFSIDYQFYSVISNLCTAALLLVLCIRKRGLSCGSGCRMRLTGSLCSSGCSWPCPKSDRCARTTGAAAPANPLHRPPAAHHPHACSHCALRERIRSHVSSKLPRPRRAGYCTSKRRTR